MTDIFVRSYTRRYTRCRIDDELLRGYVNRKKEQEALDELERDIERILDDWRAGGLI